MRVYVAGPYSGGQTDLNVREAILAGERLAKYGHTPYIPHLSILWNMMTPHSYEFWMEQTGAWLELCDALVVLPGDSPGAESEVEHAKNLDIPVYQGVEAFLEDDG